MKPTSRKSVLTAWKPCVSLDKWSWDGYQERLTAKGYELYLRKDKKDVIRGYVLLKGNTKFKASELERGAT